MDLSLLLLVRQSIWQFRHQKLVGFPAIHRPVLPYQGQDQVKVVPLVETALADVAARLAGRLGDGAGHDQARIAALDQGPAAFKRR